MPTPTELAQTAYEAYGATTDHKNYQGLPMPTWNDLGEPIQAAWTAAAKAAAGTDLALACAEAEEYRQDAQRTCVLVADMHKAAVGEVRGPIRGVVEDVEDVRTARQQAEQQLALLHEGEQPPPQDENVQLSPAQWIWRWNRATPEVRLEVARQVRRATDDRDRYELVLRQIGARCACHVDCTGCSSAIARRALGDKR